MVPTGRDRDRESIVGDLASSDEDVRRLALERTAVLALDEMFVLLAEGLGDASWRVRKAAVERFVACPDTERVAAVLVAALSDGDNPGRRNAAVEALVRIGSRVVPALVEATATPDADVRKFAVDALAGIGDPAANERLGALLADADPNVRAAAADALGATGGPEVSERLLSAAVEAGEDASVRFAALRALSALEEPLRASDLAPVLDDPILRGVALDLLGRRGDDPEARDVLLKGIASGSRSARVSAIRSLLRLLGRADGVDADRLVAEIRDAAAPEVVDFAVEQLDAADLATRLVLVQFIGLADAPRAAVPVLLAGRDEALTQVCLDVLAEMGEAAERELDGAWDELGCAARRDACGLFGRTSGPRGAQRLLACLGSEEAELRLAAIRAVARRGLTRALPALVERLERTAVDDDLDGEDELQAASQALVALAERVEPITEQAVELLCGRLEGASEPVRVAIAGVLGCIGRHHDVELVAFLLKDPSGRVRRAAVQALARLEPGSAAEPLRLALADEEAGVRIAAAQALGRSASDEVIADLEGLASDGDARVRAAAIRALGGRLADGIADAGSAREMLERALEDEVLVALAAVGALMEVGGEAAGTAACSVLSRPEPELVKDAVCCVGRHAAAEALDALIPLVAHADWAVRAEAMRALAERRVVRAVPPILRRLELEDDAFVREAILRALQRLEG